MATSSSPQRLFGVLNLYKPPGVTSRDVVNIVQRLVQPNKAGHAGTLDPMATGVLLVCVGQATRLVSILQQAPKTYRAEFRFGQRSDTDDSTGEIENIVCSEDVSQQQVEAALRDFIGVIEQMPPAYSAVKIDGQRAYALARKGQEVTLQPRPVRIDSIDVLKFHWPDITLDIQCGSGTYIRSIARDLGNRLGCGGLMTALERTRIGKFRHEHSVNVDTLNHTTIAQIILPAVHVVDHISQYRCSAEEQAAISRGGSFELRKQQLQKTSLTADRPADKQKHPSVALVSECGTQLLALAEIRRQGRRIQPRTVFMSATNGGTSS
ncbi:MAG: tRNA pseudouridine(55) synthase TruB [Fuerstiella sp.]|nr:tRNA pseudouridine(55) synthase TruB [Fuerstiella sp.]